MLTNYFIKEFIIINFINNFLLVIFIYLLNYIIKNIYFKYKTFIFD